MSHASQPRDICDRTLDYALRAVDLFDHLQSSSRRAGWIIANQYLRSATSIGANMEEAQAGESRSDFTHKCAVALKEARESLFWLRLLERAQIIPTVRLTPLIQETREIVAILTTIVVKTKRSFRPRLPLLLYSLICWFF
ncbi:MAG TPA: four helix bundle protein [Phycisphaerae bacterium]|jgi:four helix bundle protein